MKKVAIVILNWNGRKLMEEFLPSVVSNSPEYAPKRKENLEKSTLSTIPELMRDSLILVFYLKGKRTFKAIKDRR